MPYRRLPNTDRKRIKALNTIILVSEDLPSFKLPFSFKSLQEAKVCYANFNREIVLQQEALKHQVDRQKEYSTSLKKTKLYVSHFIQVVNMGILRGDLPSSTLKHYGLKGKRLPSLSNESILIKIGTQIIEGERERTLKGGNPITNPTIALVNVRFQKFIELNRSQKILRETYLRASNNVAKFRPEIDILIQNVWNEIETHFSNLPDDAKREMSSTFGVEYVLRRGEKSEEINDYELVDIDGQDDDADKKTMQYSIDF